MRTPGRATRPLPIRIVVIMKIILRNNIELIGSGGVPPPAMRVACTMIVIDAGPGSGNPTPTNSYCGDHENNS